jgi:hypothetical protein
MRAPRLPRFPFSLYFGDDEKPYSNIKPSLANIPIENLFWADASPRMRLLNTTHLHLCEVHSSKSRPARLEGICIAKRKTPKKILFEQCRP